MTTMHDDDGHEYDDDDNDGDDDDTMSLTTVMNIADSRVVLGTIVHTYDCGYWDGTQEDLTFFFFNALIAQQMKLFPPDDKIQLVVVGHIFPKIPPLIALCAVEPLVGTKTLRPAAVSELQAGKAVPGGAGLAPFAISEYANIIGRS